MAKFWKPGNAPPALNKEILSSDKPSIDNSTVGEKSEKSITLSKSVLNMKFMKRKDESDKIHDEQRRSSTFTDQLLSMGNDTYDMNILPTKDQISVSFQYFPGRRSFGGFNRAVERYYHSVIDEKQLEEVSRDTLTDEEMLKRYENLVGLPRGPNQGIIKINDKKRGSLKANSNSSSHLHDIKRFKAN